MNSMTIVIIAVVSIVMIVGIVLAIVLPKIISKKCATKYNVQKTTKMNNYEYLNETHSALGQNVLVGDSITEIYNTNDLFEEYTKSTRISVYNRGISGDTSDKMLDRMEKNVVNIEPRNLCILIGTNDIGKLKTIDTIKNIEKAIELVQLKCPETNIVLQAIYPVNSVMSIGAKIMVGGRTNKTIKEMNGLIKKVAKAKGVTFLDLTKNLCDIKGNLNASYCYDGLHLDVHGYEVVTKQLLPLLK